MELVWHFSLTWPHRTRRRYQSTNHSSGSHCVSHGLGRWRLGHGLGREDGHHGRICQPDWRPWHHSTDGCDWVQRSGATRSHLQIPKSKRKSEWSKKRLLCCLSYKTFQALLLDAQNCSGESALFRAMFQGKRSITHLLLDEGASSFSMARVQKSYTQSQCFVGLMSYLHRPPSISNLPSLLAPMLGDSPCLKQVCKRLKAKPGEVKDFSVPVFNQIVRQRISPFIDLGWFCTREVPITWDLLRIW